LKHWCLRLAPNTEIETADAVRSQGIPVHLALRILRTRTASRRWSEKTVALIPYARMQGTDDDWHTAKNTKGVLGLMPMSRRDVQEFLIMEAQAERGDWNPDGPLGHIKPGTELEVIGGVFSGLSLRFARAEGNRVKGTIKMLGGDVDAEIGVDDVDWRKS